MSEYGELYSLATPRQREYLEAVDKYGTQRKAAEALGVTTRTVERGLAAAKQRYALHYVSAQSDRDMPIPEPFRLRGVSTLYKGDGSISSQWVKSEIDKDKLAENLKAFIDGLTEELRGAYIPEPQTAMTHSHDHLAVYPMGDPHFGMYSWAEETGEDFDLEIAERDITTAMTRLLEQAPPAEEALILNLGDFFHVDNSSNMTSRSGHVQDVDSRYAKVMRVGARAMVNMVKMALVKHQIVTVRNVIGNHDDESSMALALILEAYFHDEPRAHIVTSPAQVWYYEFGKSLIGTHHGHSIRKAANLPGIMAFDMKEAWARTDYRYWYLGHIHHTESNEWNGVKVEYFRTLASRDAYTAGAGYRSGRDMQCIVHHRSYGEVERFIMSIQRIRDGE